MASVLKINNREIPNPQTLQWDKYDIDSRYTKRNQLGDLTRDRLTSKRKINCTWGPMEPAEMAALLQAMSPQQFTLTFPDAQLGFDVSGIFYVGDRTAPLYMWNQEKGKYLWTNLSANFIEF